MQKSQARQRTIGIASALICLAAGTLDSGCTAHRPPPAHLRAEFDVAPTANGRYIVWWLRLSGPEWAKLVHQSARKPQLGSLNALVHRNVDALITTGLALHGLDCDPDRRTVAILKDGTVQFTGYCPALSALRASGQPLL